MTGQDQWSGWLGTPGDEPDPARLDAMLALPVDALLAVGGDDRQIPRSGRNAYGFPLSDIDPLLRGSSCTATPPDDIALADADRWRARLQSTVLRTGVLPSADALRAPVVERILTFVGLSGSDARRIVLTPSGTDAEAVVSALALAGNPRPLRNILVGAAEAGSGSRLSAEGRHFSTRLPFCSDVEIGETIAGFDGSRVSIVDVELRDSRGRARRAFDVEAEIEAHLEDALDCNEQVLVHVMAGSKTGLRQLDPAWVRTWRQHSPEHVRVVVDAAQGRCTPGRLRDFLRAGASVSMTGSKALCAPPFCGALILDDALLQGATRARHGESTLPIGLRDLLSEADLPVGLRGLMPSAQRANLGLLARWTVALDEAQRFTQVSPLDRELFVADLVGFLHDGLARLPRVRLLPLTGAASSIVSFMLIDAAGEPLPKAALGAIYASLVAHAGVQLGQPVELAPGGAAVLRFAIGATTVTRSIGADCRSTACPRAVAGQALDVLGEILPEFAVA